DEDRGKHLWLAGKSIEHNQVTLFPIVLYDGGLALSDLDPAITGKTLQSFPEGGSCDAKRLSQLTFRGQKTSNREAAVKNGSKELLFSQVSRFLGNDPFRLCGQYDLLW